MKLWDAAIAEFENASRDPSIRRQAVIGLANCYSQTNDAMQAVKLLEQETALAGPEEETQDELKYHLGILHEQMGNGDEALKCYQQVTPGSHFAEEVVRRMRSLRGNSE
ncbi:tetratricopeptide repeat protein [bacterium]|nr:tetratricopeptide repeat protein [bacterium]